MGAMTRKLHSQRGASILMALVFLLVCGFVGAVILGSATANAEKVRDRRAQQQTYYSVSCAARLIRDTLENVQCRGSEYEIIHECQIDPDKADIHPFVLTEGTAAGLTELLRQAAETVYKSDLTYNKPTPFHGWSKTFTVEGEGLDDVQVEMQIESDYTLTFLLRPADETRSEDFAMTLLCEKGGVEVSDPVETGEGTCTHLVKNDDPTSYDEFVERTYPIYRYTRTTTISWKRGVITKGVWAGG